MVADSGVETREGRLILDSHKLPWHFDRIQAWEAGERIAPVSIDMALTRACQASCSFCYATLQEPQERSNVTIDRAYAFLEDCAEMGVRGISLISDGESSLSPAYVPFITRAAELGIDVGNASNGWIHTSEMLEQVLPNLKWVRFTVAAGRPDAFLKIMHHDIDQKHVYWNAMANIAEAVRIKRKRGLGVTLGIQMVLTPKDKDEIIPFAQLGLDLGVDYAVIKHCSDDEYGSLGINYADYAPLEETLKQAEAMSTEQTRVIVKWTKIHDGDVPPYQRVYGPPFLLQISGSGLVTPSGMFFNSRYSKLHIGNFAEERFIDIWRSDHYWNVMNYIASPAFEAHRHMGTLPITHYINTALDRHVKGIQRIVPSPDPAPLHVNFL